MDLFEAESSQDPENDHLGACPKTRFTAKRRAIKPIIATRTTVSLVSIRNS